jgi:hypothetical protein
MQQRYYDPIAMRFLSVNPAQSEFSRYAYGANNPYKYVDPDGRIVDTIFDIGSLIYDGGQLIGAAAAYSQGVVTGDANLTNVGAAAVASTGTALAISAVATAVPGVPAVGAKAAVNAAEAVADSAKASSVALDTNAVIARLEGNAENVASVTKAMDGRSPVISMTAAKEFLQGGGDAAALRAFLVSEGGGIGKAGGADLVKDLMGAGLKGPRCSSSGICNIAWH